MLKEIYAALDRMNAAVGTDGAKESVYALFATIIGQRLLTGDPNDETPVGLIHGESPIKTVMRELDTANRAIKNWRNP